MDTKNETATSHNDVEAVERLGAARDKIVTELRKKIVGMDEVIDEMMIAIFARGHCLLVGVPGLAKTLLVSSLAETMSLGFKRIQFTPDLMPSDITGTELLQEDPETHQRRFKFQKGPVFTNLLLADEINRTPPKTQAALLEAMQEKRVSSGGEDYKLDEPFFVLATQNPIEQEGTYPLPEAQLDRFLFNILVKYPSESEERDIVRSVTGDDEPELPLEKTISTGAPLNLDQADPVAEAEFHMAYGLYDQAADLLVRALNDEPDNRAYRVKLLEVYIETRDQPGFQQQYLALQGLGDEAAVGEVKEMLSTVDGSTVPAGSSWWKLANGLVKFSYGL